MDGAKTTKTQNFLQLISETAMYKAASGALEGVKTSFSVKILNLLSETVRVSDCLPKFSDPALKMLFLDKHVDTTTFGLFVLFRIVQ